MEIKELSPKAKEIVIQPKEKQGIYLDTFSYVIGGSSHLYIVSQIHSNDSSLDYLPNLIASFIKRELETNGNQSPDKDEKFENSLKKANELIDGVIRESSEVKFNVGVALFNNEKISLSKIGKAKMLLSRNGNGEVFDVFENLTQFNKVRFDNKKFSSIISGELKDKDRLFFFIPGLRLNLKQKHISANLGKENQEKFVESFHKLANAVPCSAIHMEIKEELKKINQEKPKNDEQKITATEVSKIDKNDAVKNLASKLKNSIFGGESKPPSVSFGRSRSYGLPAIIAVALLIVAVAFVVSKLGNGKIKEEMAAVNEKIKLAESRFLLKENLEARRAANEAIGQLALIKESDDREKLMAAAINILYRIEKVNTSVKPAVAAELTEGNRFGRLAALNGKILLYDLQKVYELENGQTKVDSTNSPQEVWDLAGASFIIGKDSKLAAYEGNIKILNLEDRKISEIRRKFNFEPLEMKNYEDNLYFLGQKNIYKISNALVKTINESEWLKAAALPKIEGNFVSFALDSSIYVLTDTAKLVTLFKGDVVKTVNLEFETGPNVELVNLGDPSTSSGQGKRLLAVDKNAKIARLIDADGNIQESYDLSEIDSIKDTYFDKENATLYLLSSNRVWELKL